LADGGTLKVRQVPSVTKVALAAGLAVALDDAGFPPPIAVVGRFTVEAWVEGTPLSALPLTHAHVDAAADLLGRLHARTHVPGHAFRRELPLASVLTRFRRQLADLAAQGTVSQEEAALLVETAAGLPERATRGVIHGDFAADNLVLTPDGRLVSIDNERLRFHFLDFDLARVWTRWPLPAWAWTRFERRYATWGRPPADADADVDADVDVDVAQAWRVVATVHRAHRLSRARGADPIATLGALGALRALAGGPG
jgi:aminoglycoside phosphotransferase (APT) family kinase protein